MTTPGIQNDTDEEMMAYSLLTWKMHSSGCSYRITRYLFVWMEADTKGCPTDL